MSEPMQIYTIVNELAEQSLGIKDLQPTEASFVAVGKEVLSTENNRNAFKSQLNNLIGRTVFAIRPYEYDEMAIHKEPIDFGMIMRKFSFTMPKAQQNPTWNGVGTPSASLQEKTDVKVRQNFFSNFATWEVPSTIPDRQLKGAFRDAESMGAFIGAYFTNAKNSLKVAYENVGNVARSSFIGGILKNGTSVVAVNLLQSYYDVKKVVLTPVTALQNADFLRFAAWRMKLVLKRMKKMSTTFNYLEQERHTPAYAQVVEVLTEFATAFDTYLQSDVFHNEITKLPNYNEIAYWQGSGKNWDFESTSSINLTITEETAEGEESTTTLTANYVVALVRDIDAIGTTIEDQRTTSFHDSHNEITNYWDKADLGYYRDMSENGIVFYLGTVTEDEPDTPTTQNNEDVA